MVNDWSGKRNNGVKVPSICIKAAQIAIRLQQLVRNIKPKMVSQTAKIMIDISEGMRWKVNNSMVFLARSSAGLRWGKNFKAPNQR